MRTPPRYPFPDTRCETCGHIRIEHATHAWAAGHKGCHIMGCHCPLWCTPPRRPVAPAPTPVDVGQVAAQQLFAVDLD